MNQVFLVICTFPDLVVARQIGTVLVEKQLAACVNLIPQVESIYRWQGKVEAAEEVVAIFKTSDEAYAAFEEELARLHPYEVPEIVAVKPASIAGGYLAWVLENAGPPH
jgi:periplasmic divalent cation tolerance protein